MIYQIEKIKSVLESSSAVALAAGVASMANRVFIKIGETDLVGGLNMGRLPIIQLKQVNVDYTFEAEPDHVGTRSSEFLMRLIVPSFINRSQDAYKMIERIKVASISAISKELTLGVTDVRESVPVITQAAIAVDISFTTESTYDHNYSEGT